MEVEDGGEGEERENEESENEEEGGQIEDDFGERDGVEEGRGEAVEVFEMQRIWVWGRRERWREGVGVHEEEGSHGLMVCCCGGGGTAAAVAVAVR